MAGKTKAGGEAMESISLRLPKTVLRDAESLTEIAGVRVYRAEVLRSAFEIGIAELKRRAKKMKA